MLDYETYKEESFRKNPEIRKECESLNTEFSSIRTILDACLKSKMTQQELAQRAGVTQRAASKVKSKN